MQRSLRKQKNLIFLLFLVVLCGLIMLPRLMSSDFGLLDDGVTLSIGREIQDGTWEVSWEQQTGRFRPVYWLINGLIYSLVGQNPLGFFLVNTLVLALIAISIVLWVHAVTGNFLLSGLAAVFFITAGPTIEPFYTNSKAEPFQVLLILLCTLFFLAERNANRKVHQALFAAACGFFMLLAMLIKETSIAILPVYFGWWLLHRCFKLLDQSTNARWNLAPIVVVALAVLGFFYIRGLSVSVSMQDGGYSGRYLLSGERIISSLIRWAGWIVRDFPFVFPLVAGYFVVSIETRTWKWMGLLLEAGIWAAGWVLVFLPWGYTAEYYLLPATVGIAIISAIGLERIIHPRPQRSLLVKGIIAVCLLFSFAFWGIVQLRNISNGQIQIAVDRANTALLDYLAEEAPADASLAVNLPYQSEYRYEIELYLTQLMDRPDLVFNDMLFTSDGGRLEEDVVLGVTARVENTVRQGPRIGALTSEADFSTWLQAFQASGSEAELLYETREAVHLFNLDLFQLGCLLFPDKAFCATETPLLDRRVFHYGWDVYRLTP